MSWHRVYPGAGGGPAGESLTFRPMTPDIRNWIPQGLYGMFASEGTNIQYAPFGTWWFTAYSSPVAPNHFLWITAVGTHGDTVLQTSVGTPRHWSNWRTTGLHGSDYLVHWTQMHQNSVPRNIVGPSGTAHILPPVFSGGYFGTALRTYFMRTNWSNGTGANIVLVNYPRTYTFNLPPGVAWMAAEEDAPSGGQFTVYYSTSTTHPGATVSNFASVVPQKVAYCYHTGPEATITVSGTGYMVKQPEWRV